MSQKEPKGSLPTEGKEPVIERIFQLVDRYPSRSAAARAWGINVNTLKNYYRRKDIHPTPRPTQLSKIAEVECVSVEWLATGEGQPPKDTKKNHFDSSRSRSGDDLERLTEMLAFLSAEERRQLIETLTRKGIETILYLLDEDNIKLLKLDRVMKEKVLGLQPRTPEEVARDDEEARECGPDTEGETLPQSLASNSKRAG
ncbi:hypothetical protein ACSFCT_11080 [Yokenella regensburgei]|uniref:hypothetical protein n=1 Tax=Yokenella regensburgei TaxID=158877 RepID=UPI003ED960A1